MSGILGYTFRRLYQSLFVLFGVSIFVFYLTRILPGAPARTALGPEATQEQVQAYREELGFDEPIHIQFVDWLAGILVGDWGQSLRTGNNVLHDIFTRLPATIELVLVALFFAILIGVPLGAIAGSNKDRIPDHISRLFALVGVSMPRFWVGIVFQVLFVVVLGGLFPLTGRLSNDISSPPSYTGLHLIDSVLALDIAVFLDASWHIFLPALALGLSTLAQVTRLIRSDMIDQKDRDYIMAAQAYGLPNFLIKYKYMLLNSISSSLTIIGLAFGFLVGNAFLIEIVFAWPGMASYGVSAILYQDLNAIVGVTFVVAIAFSLANLVVDLLRRQLDPRIGYD